MEYEVTIVKDATVLVEARDEQEAVDKARDLASSLRFETVETRVVPGVLYCGFSGDIR